MSGGHGIAFSRWACRLTIKAMLWPRTAEARQDIIDGKDEPSSRVGVPWDVPDWSYLHTWTFADPEPSYVEARRRFNSFLTHEMRPSGYFGVLVPQFGEETNRLHFHAVTVQRIDAKWMWSVLPKYGIGRYDVRRRPAWRLRGRQIHPATWYAARYVSRRDLWPEELKGMRQWSVFGAKYFPWPGVCRVRDVQITRNMLTVAPESHKPLYGFLEWRFAQDTSVYRRKLRCDAPENDITDMREINSDQQKRINELLALGDIVGVGEYRFCGVETKEMEQWKDGKKTGNKESRVIITHKIDFGVSCERREFDEILPAGATAETVIPPAKSGDTVAVCIDGMRAFQGGTNYKGRVVNLSAAVKGNGKAP